MVLFPEGGFLRKRKAISQKYAKKNGLPLLHHVSLPRVGALQVIMDTVGPKTVANNNCHSIGKSEITRVAVVTLIITIATQPKPVITMTICCLFIDCHGNSWAAGLNNRAFQERPLWKRRRCSGSWT